MDEKRVIIIGAGIAGLSAGCYLQMNGYDVELYEAHSIPGGLCTSWKQGGYTFDGCLHSIGGLKPTNKLYHWWQEVIDLDEMEFHFYDELCQIVDVDGSLFHLHVDPDKLAAELKRIAPEDGNFIDDMVKAIKHFTKHDLQLSKPLELWNPLDYFLSQFRSGPHMRYFIRWKDSLEVATANLKSEKLKNMVRNQDFFSHYPAYFFMISIAHMYNKNSGYPIGGSLPWTLAIEEKFKKLGGQISYNARVSVILVEDDKAVGIVQEDGTQHQADLVISAADGYQTIFQMLDGKYRDDKINERYQEHPMWPSAVLVSLGLSRTFAEEAEVINLQLAKPLVVDAESSLESLPITIYKFDPTLAQDGHTCLRAILKTANYRNWQELRENDFDQYEKEKMRVAHDFIDILDKRLGNIKEHVQEIDVATPATFIRYTNNWKGSTQGWDWLPGLIPETMEKTLPGLKNFYMIGQWVSPGGGVSTAFVAGRDLCRIICKRDGRKFKTEK